MKKSLVKAVSFLMAIMMMSALFCMSAFAANGGTMNVSGENRFTEEWEYCLTFSYNGVQAWTMYYGYDTDWTNEDYTWTISQTGESTAYVYRNGYDTDEKCAGSTAEAGKYSKIEVTHRTADVDYSCLFSDLPATGVVIEINPSSIKG